MRKLILVVLGCMGVSGVFAEDMVIGVLDFIGDRGVPIEQCLDCGTEGVQYPSGFPLTRLFDGITNTTDDLRWLGGISSNAYVKVTLPEKSACRIHSYKLHKLTMGPEILKRTPTAWEFYGVKADGTSVLLDAQTGIVPERLSEAFPMSSTEAFTAFKWVPTDSQGCQEKIEWDVGLMELEINVYVPTRNIRAYICQNGYLVDEFVDGGTEGEQYAADGYGPDNLFDGETTTSADKERWLGRISKKTYAQVMLPLGHACRLDSYRLHALSTDAPGNNRRVERTPTAWELYGITADGGQVLLDSRDAEDSEPGTGWLVKDFQVSSSDQNDQKFIGFKWVPTNSWDYSNKQNWDVGLLELELFGRDFENSGARVDIRTVFHDTGRHVAGWSEGGTEGVQYPIDYSPARLFDGVTVVTVTGSEIRWLGRISSNTYARVLLPTGYSCGIYSYRLHSLPKEGAANNLRAERLPVAWKFYGVTDDGTEILLDERTGVTDARLEFGFRVPSTDARFIAFKWVPTDSLGFRQKTDWDVGLVELEVFGQNLTYVGEDEPVSLRIAIRDEGHDVTRLIDGGTENVQYAAGYGPNKLFDGETKSSAPDVRWLGRISSNTYFRVKLPPGYVCDGDSYRLHTLPQNSFLRAERTPTAWELYGVMAGGAEVLLDRQSTIENAQVDLLFRIPPVAAELTAFKWVPTYSWGRKKEEDWDVGLLEVEIFVKNFRKKPGMVILFR